MKIFNLPYIPTGEDLVNNAFSEGAKIAKSLRSRRAPREKKIYKSEERRIEVVSKVIESNLRSIIKNFPSYEQLPAFYQKLLDIRIDRNRYKKSLGAVNWCLKRIRELRTEILKEMGKTRSPELSKQFLGRTSSLIKQISDDLDELIEIKKILKNFPSIEEIPTIVIAGYPNAGKSTLLKTLTGSNVKTAGYPFTTKSIMIGKKIHKYKEYQIIDSPGLLDRPMNERNRIELQAILAIEELSDVIIFLIDPTAMLDPQLSLLNEIRKFCPSVLVVINKKDLVDGTTIRNLTKKLKQFSPIVVSVTDRKDCETVFLRTVNLCCN